MKTISIKQPWADAIINHGKDIENRDWATSFRGKILIHTGKKFDKEGLEYLQNMGYYLDDSHLHLQTGGIVGITEIVDCVKHSNSEWFFGEYGFVLKNSKPLPFTPCNGQLMIYETEYYPQEPVEYTIELEQIAIKMNSNPNLTYLESQAEYAFENREIILFE